eukprot:TRINITY_DN306_c0_g2_i1.p1 TRINITY_DN306_c0_g2~~TRINITY_DN306_c0_g2_i1.p1  ORF type:complete len:637 (-),score=164.32 TRINITY_DN306_c0_g2_i1:326-2149(-)
MSDQETIINLANKWLEFDKNEKNRRQIQTLLAANDIDTLRSLLTPRIEFGTAGLRGKMEAGFACMNDLTVIQTSQGLARYLKSFYASELEDAQKRGIAIGFDGRHNSCIFAHLAANIFLSEGFYVDFFDRVVPTPMIPYCILQRKNIAGIVITASHNPKQDNGYKLYWSNGAQIVSPHDKGISKSIDENEKPWTTLDHYAELKSPLLRLIYDEVCPQYIDALTVLSFKQKENASVTQRVVYTAMHGVGTEFVRSVFKKFGLPEFYDVPEQNYPNPDFPTVPFPNPEEGKSALNLAIEVAKSKNCELIIANDPDADRFAAAEYNPKTSEWKIFNGNELGILLAHWYWSQYKEAHPDVDPKNCVVLNSTVSSKMLQTMAHKEGLYYEETLTGFKWMGNVASKYIGEGRNIIFCFEEAIGYMISSICLDKDGVRCAPVFTEMAATLRRQYNRSVIDHLHYLYSLYGYHSTLNSYFFYWDKVKMYALFDELRNGGKYHWKCGDYEISHIRDLTKGFDSHFPDHKPVLPVSSSTQMITYYFKNGVVCTIRASGTEPKLKYYSELKQDLSQGKKEEELVAERPAIDAALKAVIDSVIEHFLQPARFGLELPHH